MQASSFKNIVIAVLLLLAAGQTAWIFSHSAKPSAPEPAEEAVEKPAPPKEVPVLKITKMKFFEDGGEQPGASRMGAHLSFNEAVSPEDLLDHLKLVSDDGEQIPVQVRTSWTSRSMTVQSAEIMKTFEGKRYTMTVTAGLTESGSSAALPEDVTGSMLLRKNPVLSLKGFRAQSELSGGSISLQFSAPVTADAAQAYLTVKPDVHYSLLADGKSLVLSGAFKPGMRYEVSIKPGLIAADEAVLKESAVKDVTLPDLQPNADFVGTGMFLPAVSHAGLAVEAVNVRSVDVQIDRVYPNNLFTMLQEYGYRIFDESWVYPDVPESLGGTVFKAQMRIRSQLNQVVRLPFAPSQHIPAGEHGLFRVSLGVDDSRDAKRWLILSDIGIVAKKGEKSFTVWTVSNASLKPLSGVKLTLVSDKNQRLSVATTNNKGVASLALPSDNSDGASYLIMAEKSDGDFSFLLPSRFRVNTAGLDVAGATASPTGLQGYIYGERDLYRPGEKLEAMAVVRQSNYATPPSMPLVMVHQDPRGREIRKIRLKTDTDGTASFSMAIPEYALTGNHGLSLMAGSEVIGTYAFNVEEFIPDRIKVEIETDKQMFLPGETIKAEVRSNYLFGPPAAELPVTTRAILQPAPFQPARYADYVFGDPERKFQPQEFFSGEGTLDASGYSTVSILVPQGSKPPNALEAVIYSRVSENGGRGVTARKSVVVHPYPYYIGIEDTGRNGYDYGKPIEFKFVTVDGAGKPVEHENLQARLYRNRWRTVVRKTSAGEYSYQSVNDPVLLSSQDIDAGAGEGSVTFIPPQYGSYRLEVASTTGGATAAAGFYCGGWGYSPWALENPARVEIATDKEQYAAGDVAVVQLRTPFPGRAIVSVEGNDVLDSQVVEITGNTGEVRFPVKKIYAPNVHVTALVMRRAGDIAEGSVGRAFGAVPLLVDNGSNKLGVDFAVPEEVRPESELVVRMKTAPGAVVTLAAVDEGIMQLAGRDDPDPFGFFYARRALGVDSFDTFAMLFPDMLRVLGVSKKGGDMAMQAESQFMRTEGIRRVKPVAFWSGPLRADASGMISYPVQLPDFQGALRVVAVALDGKKFGTGRTMVRVRSPLVVTPTLPRFLASGDAIEMPVTIRNDLERAETVHVVASVEGAVEVGAGNAQDILLEPGAEKTIYFPLKALAGAGNSATITVAASAGDESRRVTVDLPVRPSVPYRRDVAAGVLEADGQLLPAAEGFVPGTVTRTAVMSRLPLARFAGKLEYLIGYPYGCAEQTVSKAFPLIRFGDLAKVFAPSLMDRNGPAFMVQSAIMRLQRMQTNDGGFAYWPGGDESRPWVSAYVTHFLLEADRAGFKSGMLDAALYYVNRLATDRDDLESTAYALFDLALAGHPHRGSMDALRDRYFKKLGGTARVLLACAYGLAGDEASYNQLLVDLPAVQQGRRYGEMRSDLGGNALMLLAMVETHPEDQLVPALTAEVSRLMESYRWGTTLENALAFAALGKLAGNAEPFSGTLQAGETVFDFSDVMSFSQADLPGEGAMSVTTGEQEPVYWSVITRGVPLPDSVKPESNGLTVERSFFDRNGAPIDIAMVNQGELVVMRTRIKATAHVVKDVVLQVLLPAGLEVENARLATTGLAAFGQDEADTMTGYQDQLDDRILFFSDRVGNRWQEVNTQLRAVTPGEYALPPVQVEAMYDPAIRAAGALGTMQVKRRDQ